MDIRKTKVYTGKNGQTCQYTPKRGVKEAINEKIKVLKDFCIVDKTNEETFRARMKAEIERRPDVDFDRVLDSFAKNLIGEKFG